MILLPNEILVKIFQYLPLYSQRQCLQVCRLWNAIARTLVNDDSQKAELCDISSVSDLIQETSLDPARGLSIRQMYFFLGDGASAHIVRSDLWPLLMRGCPNIAELVLSSGSQQAYINSLLISKVDLPKLEVIRFGNLAVYPGYLNDRADLLFKHRKTLNQLCISINRKYIRNSRMGYIEDYMQAFTNLKCLSLATSCPVVFDTLIKACPQMQTLKLTLYHCTRFQVLEGTKVSDQVNSLLPGFPASQLEVLKINHDLMITELYTYLRYCCHYLSQLVLFIDWRKDTGPLFDTLDAFQDNALPLITISIKGDLLGANKLAQGLYRWFPHVNQVDFGCFNPKTAFFNYYNFSVNIDQKNLVSLLVNLSSLFDGKIGPVERVALEITTENATEWYQKEGKWNTDTQFVLKDSEQYTNASARETRMLSCNTAVISIETQSIQMLYIYFRSHQNSFAQVIHLNQ